MIPSLELLGSYRIIIILYAYTGRRMKGDEFIITYLS